VKQSYQDAAEFIALYGDVSAELEAIPPPTLPEVLEAHLRSHIPPTRLRTLKLAEEEERKGLEQLQDLIQGVA
jgi:hypothetical protein